MFSLWLREIAHVIRRDSRLDRASVDLLALDWGRLFVGLRIRFCRRSSWFLRFRLALDVAGGVPLAHRRGVALVEIVHEGVELTTGRAGIPGETSVRSGRI